MKKDTVSVNAEKHATPGEDALTAREAHGQPAAAALETDGETGAPPEGGKIPVLVDKKDPASNK